MVDPSANRRGIVAMVGCMACFSVNDAFMKLAAAHLAVSQAIFLRNVLAMLLLLAAVAAIGQLRDLRRAGRPLVVVRGLVEAVTAFCFITALTGLPIADVTAIAIGSPLIITALSGPVLGEQVGWRRWAAVLVGFAGVVLVAKPLGGGVSAYTLLAVATAVLVAIRDLITRRIDPAIPSHAITFATTWAVCLLAGAVALAEAAAGRAWGAPDVLGLVWVVGGAVFVVVGNHFVIVAFRGVDVSVVSPFRYSVMVWALLAGILVFGEMPDAYSAAGTTLIVGAGLYTLHRERLRTRTPRRAAADPSVP